MLVLALDTTTRAGSCALARDGLVIREQPSDSSRPPAARLPGELVELLDHAQIALSAIDVYAVTIGPGSFTGLRIGIATMQGLAFAATKPLIGISGFDALHAAAWRPVKGRPTNEADDVGRPLTGRHPNEANPSGDVGRPFTGRPRIATWVDAWRGEVYAALYADGREVEPPVVAHPTDLLPRSVGEPTLFIGDGAATYADLIRSTLGADAVIADPAMPLLAGHVAALATEAARAGHLPAPHAIRPLYVRRPDAEITKDALLDRQARR